LATTVHLGVVELEEFEMAQAPDNNSCPHDQHNDKPTAANAACAAARYHQGAGIHGDGLGCLELKSMGSQYVIMTTMTYTSLYDFDIPVYRLTSLYDFDEFCFFSC